MGFALAAAVPLDPIVVRTMLVPASMKLFGERNWYSRSWLEWIPKVFIDGATSREFDELVDGEKVSAR